MKNTILVSGFASPPAAEVVRRFLEKYTGPGTIYALVVKPKKQRGKACARVQFTNGKYAKEIRNLAGDGLCWDAFYLEVQESNIDIIQNPRTFVHEMEHVTLNLGCQISNGKFLVLWKAESVSVKFSTGMKKMHFFLCHNSVEYKLQLSYENICQIVLYQLPDPSAKLLLIQFRASKLWDLREKTKIFVPQAQKMMGCLDETGTLEYGQVFVQVSFARRRRFYEESNEFDGYTSTNCKEIVTGKVVVAKNPCLHPGDVRVLEAIDVAALYHMVDCVVFPRKGKRPHPNECSGSDLDGDLYFVSWDPELIPPKHVRPTDYNPAPNTQLDHNVTIEEVKEYFANYIVSDNLGIISRAHEVFADKEPSMALSKPCLELSRLFSIAVDFPKTGIPAEIPPHLRVKDDYPDFMGKRDKPSYKSSRVIGKLFRKVKKMAPHFASFLSFTKDVARRSYDPDMEVDGFRKYIDEAFEYKTEFDNKLGNLMEYYGIKTEAEILSGRVMKMLKTFDRRNDAETVGAAVRSLMKEARSWFRIRRESQNLKAKASAWYHVAYHPDFWGRYNVGLNRDHYISFPWCVYDKLIQIKKAKSRRAT